MNQSFINVKVDDFFSTHVTLFFVFYTPRLPSHTRADKVRWVFTSLTRSADKGGNLWGHFTLIDFLTHTRTHTNTHSHIHTCEHTHTRTHTHRDTHIHTPACCREEKVIVTT